MLHSTKVHGWLLGLGLGGGLLVAGVYAPVAAPVAAPAVGAPAVGAPVVGAPVVGAGQSRQMMCDYDAGLDVCPSGASGGLTTIAPSPLTTFSTMDDAYGCTIEYAAWPVSQEYGPADEYREVCQWALSGEVDGETQIEFEVCGGSPSGVDDELFLQTLDEGGQTHVHLEEHAGYTPLTPSSADCYRGRYVWPLYAAHTYTLFEFRLNPQWLGAGVKTLIWSTASLAVEPTPTDTPDPAATATPPPSEPTPTPTLPSIDVTDVPGSWLDPKSPVMFLPLLLRGSCLPFRFWRVSSLPPGR